MSTLLNRLQPFASALAGKTVARSTTASRCWLSSSTSGPIVLVLGSSGALGSVVSKHLSSSHNMTVVGADVVEIPQDFTGDWALDGFVSLPRTGNLTDLTLQLVRGVHYFLHSNYPEPKGLDAIIVASGGWMSDPEEEFGDSEQTIEENAKNFCSTVEDMRRKNLDPCLASGFIAQQFMNPNGLLVVTGATAALNPTPGMVGYGLAKTAAHFYVQTLGACTGQSLESKSVRKEGRKARNSKRHMDSLVTVAILPTTIDTGANRRAFPNGDYSEWVRPLDIASEIATWVTEPSLRPHSGSLVNVRPAEQQQGASFELAR